MSLDKINTDKNNIDQLENIMPNLPAVRNTMGIAAFAPALDMYEENNCIIVESLLAGIEPDDVEVSVDKGILTIQGKSSKEHEVEEKNYYHKETRSGSFFRQILLPTPVLADEVTAEFDNGILKIELPKQKQKKSTKVNVKISRKKNK